MLGRGLASGPGVPAASCSARSGCEPEVDEAGNAWAYLAGDSEPALARRLPCRLRSERGLARRRARRDGSARGAARLGGHGPSRRRTLALVDWADEEGARFGRSLFGSSAAAGTLDPAELANARDADGRRAPGVLAENGVELERVLECSSRLERLGAYLELHIEQGPVLEAEGIRAAAVSGCAGVERHRFVIRGRVSHAGTTPMDARHDAGLAAAARGAARRGDRASGGRRRDGRRHRASSPASPPRSPGEASMLVDLRHRDADALARMLERDPRSGRATAPRRAAVRSPRSRSGGSSRSPSIPSWSGWPAGVRAGDRDRLRAAERSAPRRRLDGPRMPDRDGLLPVDRRGQPRAARRTPRRRTCAVAIEAFGDGWRTAASHKPAHAARSRRVAG